MVTPVGKLASDPEEDFMTRENALEQLESVVDIIDNAKGNKNESTLFVNTYIYIC